MLDHQKLSRRERHRADRRAQILDGAARVFGRKGFHAATTKEIAEAADVSEGTIYNYFDSKDDLLLQMMARLRQREERTMEIADQLREEAESVDFRELLEALLRARQTFATENIAMLRAIVSEMLVDHDFAERCYKQMLVPTLHLLEAQLQHRIEDGEIRPVDPSLFARYFVAASLGLFELLFLGDPVLAARWGSAELAEDVTSFFLDGLQAGHKEPSGA